MLTDCNIRLLKVAAYVHRHLKHLRLLDLWGGEFTDDGLSMLTTLTALRSLSLSHCESITDKGLTAVVVPLSGQSLARVDVSGCYKLTALSSVSPIWDQMSPMSFSQRAGRCLILNSQTAPCVLQSSLDSQPLSRSSLDTLANVLVTLSRFASAVTGHFIYMSFILNENVASMVFCDMMLRRCISRSCETLLLMLLAFSRHRSSQWV